MPAPASPPPPINPLASRIQPTGVQAAGSTGLTADAGHVHASGGGGLPRVESGHLAAIVNLAVSVWTNIFTITLPAGNWVLSVSLSVRDDVTNSGFVAVVRIADHTGTPLAASEIFEAPTSGPIVPVTVEWPVTSDGVSAFTVDANPGTAPSMAVQSTTVLVSTAGAAVSRWVAHETA